MISAGTVRTPSEHLQRAHIHTRQPPRRGPLIVADASEAATEHSDFWLNKSPHRKPAGTPAMRRNVSDSDETPRTTIIGDLVAREIESFRSNKKPGLRVRRVSRRNSNSTV